MHKASTAWIQGGIGMVIFAASLPATRVAVAQLPPLFVTSARASLAGLLAAAALLTWHQARPRGVDWPALAVVALGVVVGFPLLTALALRYVTSAHSLVFIGLLPLSTALFGVLRGEARPAALFWVFSALGAACVVGFALSRGGQASPMGDGLMLAAIVVCGLGYAEGAKLSRRLGGWQVISWALLISWPVMAPLALATWPRELSAVGAAAWIGLGYVSVFSMFVGFIFWYRGLALGGSAAIGQLQLVQPFIGLVLAAWLLGERVDPSMPAVAAMVVACVAMARRYAAAPAGR